MSIDPKQILRNRQCFNEIERFNENLHPGSLGNPFYLALEAYSDIWKLFEVETGRIQDEHFAPVLLMLAVRIHLKIWSKHLKKPVSTEDLEKIWCRFCQLSSLQQEFTNYSVFKSELQNQFPSEQILRKKYELCIEMIQSIFWKPVEFIDCAITRDEWRAIEWPSIHSAWDWALVEYFTFEIQNKQDFKNFDFSKLPLQRQADFLEHYLRNIVDVKNLDVEISLLRTEIESFGNFSIGQKIVIFNQKENSVCTLYGEKKVPLTEQQVKILQAILADNATTKGMVERGIASNEDALKTAFSNLRKLLKAIELDNLIENNQPGDRKNVPGTYRFASDFKMINMN